MVQYVISAWIQGYTRVVNAWAGQSSCLLRNMKGTLKQNDRTSFVKELWQGWECKAL